MLFVWESGSSVNNGIIMLCVVFQQTEQDLEKKPTVRTSPEVGVHEKIDEYAW